MTLSPLIEKLKAAEAGSRELDAEIAKALGQPHGMREEVDVESRTIIEWDCTGRYTTSLDAIVALVEEKLPGHHWSVSRQCEYPALAGRDHRFAAFVGNYGTPKRAEGPTPALALCIALLRAMEARND